MPVGIADIKNLIAEGEDRRSRLDSRPGLFSASSHLISRVLPGRRTSLKSHSHSRIGNPVIVSCETSGVPLEPEEFRYSLGYISRVVSFEHLLIRSILCGNYRQMQAAHTHSE